MFSSHHQTQSLSVYPDTLDSITASTNSLEFLFNKYWSLCYKAIVAKPLTEYVPVWCRLEHSPRKRALVIFLLFPTVRTQAEVFMGNGNKSRLTTRILFAKEICRKKCVPRATPAQKATTPSHTRLVQFPLNPAGTTSSFQRCCSAVARNIQLPSSSAPKHREIIALRVAK